MASAQEVTEMRKANLTKARAAKKTKGATLPATQVERKEPDFLAGINRTECPVDCTLQKCVITHANICAHPCKGGLQAAFKMRPDCVERYNKARKKLLHDALDRQK